MRIEIRLDDELVKIIDNQPGTNGRAAKIVELAVEALQARDIECQLPTARGKYQRKSNVTESAENDLE